MRVLHICPYMHPAAGGPPVVVEKMSLLTPSKGWDASIITTSLYCGDDGSNLQRNLRDKLDVQVLPARGFSFASYTKRAVAAIDRAVEQADVVHVHTLWHSLNTIARRACYRHKRKYVLMPHGMLDPYSLSKKRWRKKLYLTCVEQHNILGASRLIFTTDNEQKSAKLHLPWLPSGEIVPLAADPPSDISSSDYANVFSKRFPEAERRKCLLFLGRIHEKKGIEYLLRIMPEITYRHPDSLLVIAGTGSPTYVNKIKNLIHEYKLEGHVLLTGMLTGKQKVGAFARASIFVLPSKQENFAIAVAEAMHMAVPVIISDKVDSWPFVNASNSGFVIQENAIERGFLNKIDQLLNNPDLARGFGQRGQTFAKEHFVWSRVASDMVSVYERVSAHTTNTNMTR